MLSVNVCQPKALVPDGPSASTAWPAIAERRTNSVSRTFKSLKLCPKNYVGTKAEQINASFRFYIGQFTDSTHWGFYLRNGKKFVKKYELLVQLSQYKL